MHNGYFYRIFVISMDNKGKELEPRLKVIMRNATKLANYYNDSKVRLEHILLAILDDGGNPVVEHFNQLNSNADELDELYDKISHHLTNNNIYPRVIGSGPKLLPLSSEVKAVFNVIYGESDDSGDLIITIHNLMLSILRTKSATTKILNNYNINYKLYKMSLDNKDTENENSYGKGYEYEGNDDSDDNVPKKNKPKEKDKYQALNNFCRNISKAVEEGKIDPVIGRKKEIERVSKILSRRKKNNPILVGEPGVGKTAIVEGLAQLIKDGKAPIPLLGKKIFSLDLAALVAGTKYRGQFEERMKVIIKELSESTEVILFMDEIHTLVGAGGASGSMDAANILKPALARGELQCIGATTNDEYREHIEKDGALTRRFQKVVIEEPSVAETKTILHNIKERYEDHHNVTYTDEAIDECVNMADRYFPSKAQPDKSIDILDEVGASTNVDVKIPARITELEDKKTSLSVAKFAVVKKHDYEKAAKLRDEETLVVNELKGLKDAWIKKISDTKNIVTPELVAETVAMMTGIPVTKLSKQENKRLKDMDKTLIGSVIGQDKAVAKVVRAIQRNRLGIKEPNKPIGSFIFLGPTGVGKTHLAKVLAENVFGSEEAMIRIDMSEYMEKFATSKLIGSPPGYVGYEKGGKLTEAVRNKPYSVILFDEVEKAHPDVFNIMLQVLDEGHLTDSLGKKVDFKNTVIIMTSNIGIKTASDFSKGVGFETKANIGQEEEKTKKIIEKALKKGFAPEFLNRIDETIMFDSLEKKSIDKIIKLDIKRLETRLLEVKNWDINITTSAVNYLAEVGYDKKYGARPLKRAIQKYVEDELCILELAGDLKEGDSITFTHTKDAEKLSVVVSSK